EVLVAQAEAEDALREELREGVLDLVGVAVVAEAAGELVDEVELGLDLAEQQAAGFRGDGEAIEAGDDVAVSEGFKEEVGAGTLCSHGAVRLEVRKGC